MTDQRIAALNRAVLSRALRDEGLDIAAADTVARTHAGGLQFTEAGELDHVHLQETVRALVQEATASAREQPSWDKIRSDVIAERAKANPPRRDVRAMYP